jgi:Ca-activated chloride channel family protein
LVGGQSKLALMQWTGSGRQEVVIGWTTMRDQTDVLAFANEVVDTPRIWRNFSTSIGEALALALPYFAQVPECDRFVIDVSGDGPSNEGRSPQSVWPALRAAGVTVNALVIEASLPGLTQYFETDVITGPGAFAVTAPTFADYPTEIRRKLLRELTKAVAALEWE